MVLLQVSSMFACLFYPFSFLRCCSWKLESSDDLKAPGSRTVPPAKSENVWGEEAPPRVFAFGMVRLLSPTQHDPIQVTSTGHFRKRTGLMMMFDIHVSFERLSVYLRQTDSFSFRVCTRD